jgi:hypothetical protein
VLQVFVPEFSVQHVDGVDVVTIPGGDVLLEDGQPQVPIYAVPIAVPAGYVAQGVQMTYRSAPDVTTGLSLPLSIPLTASQVALSLQRAQPADSDAQYPHADYAWCVLPNNDGSSVLWLTLYPFFYNALTTDARFHREYAFAMRYSTPGVSLTRLSTQQVSVQPGDAITIHVGLHSVAPVDVLIEARVQRYGSDEPVAGLLLRTLAQLNGAASFSPVWDSRGVAPGEYDVRLTLRDTAGDVLDTATLGVRLGTRAAEVTGLAVTPSRFQPGQALQIMLDLRNSGTLDLSGTAVIEVRSPSGEVVQRFERAVGPLASGSGLQLAETWQTSGSAPGSYSVLGMLRYESAVASAATRVTAVGAWRVCLPVVRTP